MKIRSIFSQVQKKHLDRLSDAVAPRKMDATHPPEQPGATTAPSRAPAAAPAPASPNVAAASASTAPQYYAVRSTKNDVVKNAIFISWADAKPYVDDNADYESFDTFEDAEDYLVTSGNAGAAAAAGDKRKRTKKSVSKKKKKKKKSKTRATTASIGTASSSAPPTRPPTEKWQQMYDRLKQYHADHQGSTRIPTTDKANDDLRKWVPNQKSQLSAALQRCAEKDVEPSAHVQEKISKFAAVGIDIQNSTRAAKNVTYWNEMYAKLEEFKATHGNVLVPTEKPEYKQLATWVYTQQKEYRRYRDNDPKARLTRDQVVKLHDIGFVFERREKFLSWEERLEQLRRYKAEHGHCKVKTNHPELGQWTSKIRRDYREYTEGVNESSGKKKLRISAQTMEKRILDLKELGFVFQAGKRITLPPKHMQKSWDDRFEELVQYKAEHGHCTVPQSMRGLGEWVHRQRKDYKALKEGKPSKMTAERAVQLGEVGFVFDTRNSSAKAARATTAATGQLPPGIPGDESTLPPLTKNLYLPPEDTIAPESV